MTQNQNDEKTCNVCHHSFSSDRELQEHQKNAHPQKPGGSQPASNRDYKEPGQDQKREKIA